VSVGALLFMTSCKKCQTCTTTVTQDVQGFPMTSSTSQEYCGDEYDNAPAEGTVSQSAQGVSQTVTITCTEN